MSLLSISNLGLDIHGTPILKGVSLELQAGKIFALVGESGSGKSVTSMAAMRLLPEALEITAGSVHVGDQDLFDLFRLDLLDHDVSVAHLDPT